MAASFYAFAKGSSSRSCIPIAFWLGLCSAFACAQTQLATVFGTVTDPTGAVIPGVNVAVSNTDTGLKRDSFTDVMGQYHVAGLPPKEPKPRGTTG